MTAAVNQPMMRVPRGKPPCQPQSADGSSCLSTVLAGRRFSSSEPATCPPPGRIGYYAFIVSGTMSAMIAPTASPRRVLVLGSTGSIGTQALDVVAVNPDRFTVAGLA